MTKLPYVREVLEETCPSCQGTGKRIPKTTVIVTDPFLCHCCLGEGTIKHVLYKKEKNVGVIPSGTRVRVVDVGRIPSIGGYSGRTGVTYRPTEEGCYVRFDDGHGSYVFLFWDEMQEDK